VVVAAGGTGNERTGPLEDETNLALRGLVGLVEAGDEREPAVELGGGLSEDGGARRNSPRNCEENWSLSRTSKETCAMAAVSTASSKLSFHTGDSVLSTVSVVSALPLFLPF
jgi:hypothetical protein